MILQKEIRMAYRLTHPARGTVTVESAARRDVLVGRGYTEDKPAPKKTPKKPTEGSDTE